MTKISAISKIPVFRSCLSTPHGEAVHQRALAGARTARYTYDLRPAGVWKQLAKDLQAVPRAILHASDDTRKRSRITFEEILEECVHLLSQYLSRNNEPLDFAGAFTDRAEFNVSIEFFGRIFLDVTVAAMNLHALVGDAHSNLSRVEFRHCSLRGRQHALIFY